MKSTEAPSTPWDRVAADHWGPTPDGKHLIVLVDLLSRYPEVVVVKGTAAEDNIPALDDIFSRHGFPQVLYSDNGPPFNGNDQHSLQKYFRFAGIKHIPNVSPNDPEANGLAEAFMKHCKKIWHTSITERKDPTMEINKHLRVVRSTPHISTGQIPAEVLFGRKFRGRLPDLRTNQAENRKDITAAKSKDKESKDRQKYYKDSKPQVTPHSIRPGDTVLLQRKPTKTTTPYDPLPYRVSETHGTQVTANRDQVSKTRDAQQWKRVEISSNKNYDGWRENRGHRGRDQDYFPDIGPPREPDQNTTIPNIPLTPNIPTPQPHSPACHGFNTPPNNHTNYANILDMVSDSEYSFHGFSGSSSANSSFEEGAVWRLRGLVSEIQRILAQNGY